MGLLIATLRELVKADRYLRSGLWTTQNYPLSAGSLRDRKVGIVGMAGSARRSLAGLRPRAFSSSIIHVNLPPLSRTRIFQT